MEAKMITHYKANFNENAVYYFRKGFVADKKNVIINVSADARYKLWVNSKLVSVGPCKGSEREKYYDTIDISEYIESGENEIYAQVLQLTSAMYPDGHRFLCSVFRTGAMSFSLWGEYEYNNEKKQLVTDSSWECAKDNGYEFSVPQYAFYAGINEIKKADTELEWTLAKESAPVLYKEQTQPLFYGEIGNWFMSKRPIPLMRLESKTLTKITDDVYDAGEFTTGLVKISLKGKGKVNLVYGECFVHIIDGKEVKNQRDDISGEIRGDFDTVYVDGNTSFETFWFKTFRYVKIEKDPDVEVENIEYTDLCYPLDIPNDYDFGSEEDNKLWDISVRTLHRCMHETYEDCPYYEQLQYVYDTSIQMIYTYQITQDDRLARKLIHDFAQSYHFGSTVQSRFPSASIQYIAEFPMFFIMMIERHYRAFADKKMVLEYLHIIDGVILWYKNNMDESGLIKRTIFWEYIDWADGWFGNRGCPEGTKPLTVQNMLFVNALKRAAKLNRVCGRADTAKEYLALADDVEYTINKECYDLEKELYFDSADKVSFSQHPQIWAILNDMVTMEKGAEMLTKSFEMESQSAFGYTFLLIRALEKVGMYQRHEKILDWIKELIPLGCTTIPETPEEARSECHGWGSVAIYEFTARVLGVEVVDAADENIVVKPYISGREYARGSVSTKWGYIYVDWKKQNNDFIINVNIPDNIKVRLIMPDGSEETVTGNVSRKCTL